MDERFSKRESALNDLEQMPDFLQSAFGQLSAETALKPASDDGFSPVEQAWHLADLEQQGFGLRIHKILNEDHPTLPDFKGTEVAKARNYKSLSLVDGLREFAAARARNLALLRSVPNPNWERTGFKEGVGPVSLFQLVEMMAGHDSSHKGEIEDWIRDVHTRD